MTPNATVSVVIPTKGRLELVRRAIESVRAQTYQPAEVIVVDDSSAADFETLRSLVWDPLKVRVIRGRGRGDSWARRDGIHLSTGDLIALLDSDDEWSPEKLEYHVRAWKQLGAVYQLDSFISRGKGGDRIIRPPDGLPVLPELIPQPQFLRFLVSRPFIHASAIVASRRALSRVPDYPSQNPSDLLWLIALAQSGPGVYLSRPLTIKHEEDPSRLGRAKRRVLSEWRVGLWATVRAIVANGDELDVGALLLQLLKFRLGELSKSKLISSAN